MGGVAWCRLKHQGPTAGTLALIAVWPCAMVFIFYFFFWPGLGTWLSSDWKRRVTLGLLVVGLGKALCRGLGKAAHAYVVLLASVWQSVPETPPDYRTSAGGAGRQVHRKKVGEHEEWGFERFVTRFTKLTVGWLDSVDTRFNNRKGGIEALRPLNDHAFDYEEWCLQGGTGGRNCGLNGCWYYVISGCHVLI